MNKDSHTLTKIANNDQILAPHDFNDERTMVFTTLKRQRQKENIGWLIGSLLLFFFTVISAGRLTVVGQFFDDSIFNLIFGWFKYPVYLLLLSLNLAIYFGVRLKFKRKFLLMICLNFALICWTINLILFTIIFDKSLLFHQVTITKLWEPHIIEDGFKIYWFNWLDNSIFGANYAHDKMDFLISNHGYITAYAGGGVIGTLLATISMYLSIPGAFFFLVICLFFDLNWVLTGDSIYVLRPKAKRRGRSLRLLPMKSKNHPHRSKEAKSTKAASNKKPLAKTLNETLTVNEFSLPELSEPTRINHEAEVIPETTINVSQSLSTLLTSPSQSQSFTSNRTDSIKDSSSHSFPIFEPRRPRQSPNPESQKSFPRFERLSKDWQQQNLNKLAPTKNQDLNATISPVLYHSRRKSDDKSTIIDSKTIALNDIPMDKLHLTPTNQNGEMTSHFGDMDPLEAREIFKVETDVTPFNSHHSKAVYPNPNPSTGVDDEEFVKTLYASDSLPEAQAKNPNAILDKLHRANRAKVQSTSENLTQVLNEESLGEVTIDVQSENSSDSYQLPPINLLKMIANQEVGQKHNDQLAMVNAQKIDQVFADFKVQAKVVNWLIGPSVTKFEIQSMAGTKVNTFMTLENDLKLALASTLIRIEAPIPGKNLIGLEIPNKQLMKVSLKEIITTIPQSKENHKLLFVLGKTVSGEPLTANLENMPHLLIAGSTGSGKSMMINSLIISLLMRAKPEEVRFLMIDPKRVELSAYTAIPHMLTTVITQPREAAFALKELVKVMEERYDAFARMGARNLEGYHRKIEAKNLPNEKLPFYVVIIDELADLMAGDERKTVEESITRLAQMSRAAGIHLVLATQRPSVDVLTGLIKSNIPTRIAFSVSSAIDSRTIIDFAGAEKLIGRGDMLFVHPQSNEIIRAQGAYLTDQEIEAVIEATMNQSEPQYDPRFSPGPKVVWRDEEQH